MSDKQRKPFIVACRPCGHVWVAAWLPMEIDKVAKLTRRLHCPNCAEGARTIYLASAAQAAALVLPESVAP